MVFIYHRLFRPHMLDFESTPRFFRDILFKLNRFISPNKNYLKLKEHKYPIMKTSLPGPRMKNLLNDLELVTNDFYVKNFINYEKSYQNYFEDCDGNIMLDLYNQGNNILGYNSRNLYENFLKSSNLYYKNFHFKNDINNYYNSDLLNLQEETITEIKPTGLDKVIFSKNPEDLVYLLSMIRRGNIEMENNNSSFSNKKKINEKYKILRVTSNNLNNSNHLNLNYNFEENKIFEYAPFPKLNYPMKENLKENYLKENKCIEETEKILKKNFDISAIKVEAVDDGDLWATPSYFCKLRKLASLYNIDFIVDERKTGLTVGRYWQHELWNLNTVPDFVIFGNKFLNTGIFIRNEALDDKLYKNYVDHSGVDMNNILSLNFMLKFMKEKKIFEKNEKCGEYFKKNLREIKEKNIFCDIRGKSSLISFDVNSENFKIECEQEKKKYKDLVYNKFISYCRNSGIFIEGNKNTYTIYIRPSLLIENSHYDKLLNVLEDFK